MKSILITGNPANGLAKGLASVFPNADFVGRHNGCDLEHRQNMEAVAKKAIDYDVFVNNSALWHFRQTLLLELVWKLAETAGKSLHIVCIGSTTDRATKGSSWIYQTAGGSGEGPPVSEDDEVRNGSEEETNYL